MTNVIEGTSSSDTLLGGADTDLINGYEGNDQIRGEGGNDELYGGFGDDGILGGDGNDSIFGQQDNDTLYGQNGDDYVHGGSGNDTLFGYKGNDKLLGGSGNDYLNGAGMMYPNSTGPQSFGKGEIDTLTGGDGNDTFQLWGGSGRTGINVYYDASSTNDYALITDFNSAEDTIALTKVTGVGQSPGQVNYILGSSPAGLPTGTALYVDKPNTQADELIAILQNVSSDSLSLDGSYFSYFG